MNRLVGLISLVLLLLSGSCGVPGTKNVGTSAQPDWFRVTVTVPGIMFDRVDATWNASWTGGVGPFTIYWDFGGGADNIGPVAATSPDTRTTLMRNPSLTDISIWHYAVTVTDSNGVKATAEGMYTVGFSDFGPPRIEHVDYSEPVLTVTVRDPAGDDVRVSVSEIDGLSHTPQYAVVSGGSGDAIFVWEAIDVISGGSGTTTITADNGYGGTDTADAVITIHGVTYVEPDTIYVLPTTSRTAVGEPVTFVCFTGTLPSPFQYLNGVAVTIEDDADYVSNSFNVGEPGGGPGDVDGLIWTAVDPSGFLLADNLIQATQPSPFNSIPEGRERWGFNVTGLGGSDVEGVEGILFNFQFAFGSAGLKRVGLQAVDGVNRTYYSDSASAEYLWGTLMADEYGNLNVAGVDNTILVE